MIVGTATIRDEDIKRVVNSDSDIIDFSNSLIPTWARHIKGVSDNQRYIVAVYLRNVSTIPYKKRKPLIDKLLCDIALTGVANSLCTITDIVNMCDKAKLVDALRNGESL